LLNLAGVRMKNTKRTGIFKKLALFRRDKRGVSALEFAIVFPLMAAIYLGGTAATQGIVIKRKVTLTARTVGDLVSQYTNVTDATRDMIWAAAMAVTQPYPTAPLTMYFSSVNIDATGNGKVLWSEGYSMGAPAAGRAVNDIVNFPVGFGATSPNTTVIMSEVTYAYTPPVGAAYFPAIQLNEIFYSRPRRVSAITRSAT
jgi:Flp pilus assembly protein TadG